MATVTKPIALDESLNTTEQTPRNIADVLAQELSRITGRNASQVEYDNTDSGLTADNVQDAIDEVNGKVPTLPATDIQIAVDEFETYNGGLLSECKLSLSPVQDLHGYSEPWVGGAGKNKLPLVLADIKANNVSGTWSGNVYSKDGIDFTILTDDADNVLGINANGTATSQVGITVTYYTPISAENYILNGAPSGSGWGSSWLNINVDGTNYNDIGSGASFTVSANTTFRTFCYIANGATVSNKVFLPMIRLATESDPTFEPYTNICPITGHTQVDVDVSDGQTTQEQVTVNLGGTYYSGTLDIVTGMFVADMAMVTIDKNSNITQQNPNSTRFYVDCMDMSRCINYIGHIYCDRLPTTATYNTDPNTEPFVSGYQKSNTYPNQNWIYFSNGTINTKEGIKEWLADNPLQVVYELATPLTIQLTPQQVKALVGENHLSAPLEGQEITESKYKQMFTFDDVIAYIQSLS